MNKNSGFALFPTFLLSFWLVPGGAAHPLDGLIEAEYETVATVLRESGKIDASSRLARVALAEPDKQAVLAWRPGAEFVRRAEAVVRHDGKVYEALIDLNAAVLDAWLLIDDAQPQLLDEEWMLSQVILRSDEGWQEAVRRRGIENVKQVFCFPAFSGYFDTERDREKRRLGMVGCYDTGSENGLWGRPIAGLLAVIDYDEKQVIELVDTGVIPIPEGGPAVKPEQPNDLGPAGPAQRRFTVRNNWIEWDKWRFHLRIDPRVGPVISQATISYDDERRSVLYQGAVSELFVPYMDPTRNWYFRTYLYVGEYGIGTSGVPLTRGKDCPADSEMIDAAFMNERAKVYTKESIACVFERETGDAGWSHYEISDARSLNRRHTELVVRFIVWLGNYDYVLDWIFTETGALKGRVGATGIVQIRGVESASISAATALEDTRFGRLIAPGTIGVNHDHFFNFRLDVDVDGPRNRMVIDRLKSVAIEPDDYATPRRQIWQIFPFEPVTESDAQLNIDLRKPALWRVINPRRANRVGNPVSYQLQPGATGRTLMDNSEFAQRRAAFANYQLWVTPYAANERYAAGDYPNQHPGGAGLPEWTSGDRPIADTDLVLWYTIGMHHVVRAEDWPIMPTVQNEFELRPFDFFDYNPTATE